MLYTGYIYLRDTFTSKPPTVWDGLFFILFLYHEASFYGVGFNPVKHVQCKMFNTGNPDQMKLSSPSIPSNRAVTQSTWT
jgi:hypothetical protein